jgi:ribonuclease J
VPDDQVIICTGCQGEPQSVLQQAAAGKHLWFQPGRGDTIVFSSSSIPGNEHAIRGMKASLKKAGARIIDNTGDYVTHATGHPNQDELREM